MEPFERGYGHTLGNALRRVLLSSMPGYAPTEVQIAGVLHEYSTLDGVQEDVVDILLNLKGVVLKLHNRERSDRSSSKKTGRGRRSRRPTSSPSHDVEIINPDHVIAHLTAGRQDRDADQGREGPRLRAGQHARTCRRRPSGIGSILLDASFSPGAPRELRGRIARASSSAPTSTSWCIDIETNGVIEPEEAVRYAARILVDQLSVFARPEGHRRCRPRSRRRRRSTRSCCARSTTWSSRCARPTASRPRTSITSAT